MQEEEEAHQTVRSTFYFWLQISIYIFNEDYRDKFIDWNDYFSNINSKSIFKLLDKNIINNVKK